MSKTLTPQNANILTAQISIRSLTLEKKQVTLSVFRQIQEEDIVDLSKLELKGIGWGHVRYLIDEPSETAINLVWQKGSELRRCIVKRKLPPIGGGKAVEHWDRLYCSGYGGCTQLIHGNKCISAKHYAPGYVLWNGKKTEIDPGDEIGEFEASPSFPIRPYYNAIGEELAAWEAEHKKRCMECASKIEAYVSRCQDEYWELKNTINDTIHAYENLVEPLFELPQLFIAT